MEKIGLHDAMAKSSNCRIRVWELPGTHVEVKDLPLNASVEKTFVTKIFSNLWQVGIQFLLAGDSKPNMSAIAEFSTLDELLKTYPQFSEITGELYALV